MNDQCFNKWEKEYTKDNWPKAVPPSLIIENDKQKWIRSRSICNYFLNDLHDKRFLDFGCGQGHVALTASIKASRSVGYDTTANWSAASTQDLDYDPKKYKLTTDWKEVIQIPKYDTILLYDVLDHARPSSIEQLFRSLASVCSANTDIFIRCHPWTAPHGGHTYEKLNKAFAHLLMGPQQIAKYQSEYVNHILRPINTYAKWFEEYGFTILNKEIVRYIWDAEKHKEMFDNEKDMYLNKIGHGNREWKMMVYPMEYVDYHLKLK